MAMRMKAKLVATVGEYVNKQGEQKKRYRDVGILFEDPESGRMAIKLEVLPMPRTGEDGYPVVWLSCFEENNNQQQQQQQQQPKQQGHPVTGEPASGNYYPPQQQAQQPMQQPTQGYVTPDDEIPF